MPGACWQRCFYPGNSLTQLFVPFRRLIPDRLGRPAATTYDHWDRKIFFSSRQPYVLSVCIYAKLTDMKRMLFTATLIMSLVFVANFSSAQTLVDVSNSTGPNDCNGSAFITDSLNVTEVSIYWAGMGAIIQQGGYYIFDLCPGTYTVTYTYNGTTITETFTIGWDSADPCANLFVSVDSAPTLGNLICDGTVSATAYGGTAPYTYVWDNGTTSVDQSGLCEGVYYVTVTDANGCSVTGGVYVANTGDSTLVIDNTGNDSTIVIDGSAGEQWVEDCFIDFSLIDSAFIGGSTFNGVDTVDVNWVFVDSNGVVIAEYTVSYEVADSLNGTYTVMITIYCPQRAMNITTVQVTDVIELGQSAGTEEAQLEDFVVVNPFSNELQIRFESAQSRTIVMNDMNGKVVFSEVSTSSEFSGSTAELKSGMYILSIQSASGMTQKKLIKN